VNALVQLHAYGELGETEKAAAAYERLRNNPHPVLGPVRDELAARYVLRPAGHVWRSDDWVFDQECFLALAA
jgi:hypothetical protein